MLDHALGETLAVDEDDFVLDTARVVEGAFVEVAGGEVGPVLVTPRRERQRLS